jgi:hypothetical protein
MPSARSITRGLSKLQVSSPRGGERIFYDELYADAVDPCYLGVGPLSDEGSIILVRCPQLPEWGEDFSELALTPECKTIDALRQALASEFGVRCCLAWMSLR